MRVRAAIVASVTTLAIGFTTSPASAQSYMGLSSGEALRVGNRVQCTQYMIEINGAKIDNFRAEPRIQEKIVEKQRRYFQKEKWKKVGIGPRLSGGGYAKYLNVRVQKAGWVYPPDKVFWVTYGGLASPGEIIRGGRKHYEKNNRISTLNDQGRPTKPWVFSRPYHRGDIVRCVVFGSARGEDQYGKRYNIAGTIKGHERSF